MIVFFHAQVGDIDGKQFPRRMQNILWGGEVMEPKPDISF